jgi:hypothetical protein
MVSAPGQFRHPERHRPSDPNEFHFSPDLAAGEPAIDGHPRQRYFGSGGFRRHRPSVGKQVFRAIVCSAIIVAIAGLPLGWQFADENTKDMVRAWGKAWGISPSTLSADLGTKDLGTKDLGTKDLGTKSPPAAAETISNTFEQVSTRETSGRAAPVTPAASASVAPRPSPELQRQLETLASDHAVVRRLVEQLAARQDQIAQELATLQATQQNISQKSSPVPESTAAHIPPPKNARKPSPAGAPPQTSSVPIPAARPGEPLPLH